MLTQLDLLPRPERLPVYQRGSATSKEAARTVAKSGKAARDRRLILALLTARQNVGATQREMSEALGISRQALCARCSELDSRGTHQIRQTTERRRGCYVWVKAA